MNDEVMKSVTDGQKTVVAFIAGLLIGGLLVWVFASPGAEVKEMVEDNDNTASSADTSNKDSKSDVGSGNPTDTSTSVSVPDLPTGTGDISVSDQSAGMVVELGAVTFPNDEGWIGVRDYSNGQLSGLLGVARWSKEQGLVPSEVELLRATEAGKEYALVFYSESGDREFSLAEDVQLDIAMETFVAR